MKKAIDLSVLFLVIFSAVMVAIGIYFKADVLGLVSVVTIVAVLHLANRSNLPPKRNKPEGRGVHTTRKIKTIE